MTIREQLFALQDAEYRDFQVKLIPGTEPDSVIGVRTPALRKLAKEFGKTREAADFMNELPHQYFDENQLHAFLISEMKDFDAVIAELEKFLPFVNNWATCDQLSPKVFGKHTDELLVHIQKWMHAEETYTIRFGIGMLMRWYLDGNFRPEFLQWVAELRSEEYYVNMMIAWYFATALAKQYDAALPFIEQNALSLWTHNKAIQKARESFRVSDEHKARLQSLKRK